MGKSSPAFKIKKERQSVGICLFKCLYVKIVNVPQWHILGWHVGTC